MDWLKLFLPSTFISDIRCLAGFWEHSSILTGVFCDSECFRLESEQFCRWQWLPTEPPVASLSWRIDIPESPRAEYWLSWDPAQTGSCWSNTWREQNANFFLFNSNSFIRERGECRVRWLGVWWHFTHFITYCQYLTSLGHGWEGSGQLLTSPTMSPDWKALK